MTKPRTFWELHYLSFTKVSGFVLALVSYALAVLLFILAGVDNKILVATVSLIAPVVICSIVSFFNASLEAWRMAVPGSPAVYSVRTAPQPYPENKYLLTVGPAPFFAKDTEVTIISIESEIEIIVGVGRILGVQENGHFQVLVVPLADSSGNYSAKIEKCDQDDLKYLRVKPGVPDAAKEYERLTSVPAQQDNKDD